MRQVLLLNVNASGPHWYSCTRRNEEQIPRGRHETEKAAAASRRCEGPFPPPAAATAGEHRGGGARRSWLWNATIRCTGPGLFQPVRRVPPRSRGRGNDPWGQRGGRNRFIAPPSPATKLYRETLLFSVSSVVWKNYEMFQGLIYYSSRLIFSFHVEFLSSLRKAYSLSHTRNQALAMND